MAEAAGAGWTSRPEVVQIDGPVDHIVIEGEDEVSQRLCTGCVRCVRDAGGPGAVDPLLLGLGGVRSSRWSYVGNGHGRFEKWQSYSYVGKGAGEFEKEVAVAGAPTWRPRRPCWLLLLLLLLVPLLAYLVFVAVERDEVVSVSRQTAVRAPLTSTSAIPAFGCLEGEDWSALEQDWCCRSPGGRCTTTPAPRLGVEASREFDCELGLSNWRLSWPEKKKAWCCRHSRLGCLPGMPTPPPEKKKPPSPPTHKPQLPEKPTEEPKEEPKGEPRQEPKKKPEAARQAPTPAPPPPSRPTHMPTFAPPVHAAQRAAMAPFNCHEGLAEFGGLWRQEKKTWCCQHEHLGCPTTARSTTAKPRASTSAAPPPREAEKRDCRKGAEGKWSKEKRKWCCKHKQRGCEPAYDCLQSYFNWKVAWSEDKREWCCEHEDRACRSH